MQKNHRTFLISTIGVLLFSLATVVSFSSLASAYAQRSGGAELIAIKQVLEPQLSQQLTQKNLQLGDPVLIRIFKQTSELEVWIETDGKYTLFKTYPICYYSGALGPKLKEGDGQSPEGFYEVTRRQMNPNSTYHLSFNLGFPNAYDKKHNRTGSYLMVHGNCVSIGCYAMTDSGIEEIYLLADAALRGGQKAFQVQVFPFRMTPENMTKHSKSEWIDFWRNLQEGYDYFETHHQQPKIKVTNKRYVMGG